MSTFKEAEEVVNQYIKNNKPNEEKVRDIEYNRKTYEEAIGALIKVGIILNLPWAKNSIPENERQITYNTLNKLYNILNGGIQIAERLNNKYGYVPAATDNMTIWHTDKGQ